MNGNRRKSYDLIRTVSILCILVWHFNCTCNENNIQRCINILDNPNINGSLYIGGVGVALFFILSGAVLQRNYGFQLNIKQFYKKRIIRIYVPLIITWIVSFGICRCIQPDLLLGWKWYQIVINMTGMDYIGAFFTSFLWIVGEWFTTIIIIIYMIFPILRYAFKNYRWRSSFIITMLFIFNLHFQFLQYCSWASLSNGVFCFWIGMFIAYYDEWLINKVIALISFACSAAILIWNPINIYGSDQLPNILLSICLFICLNNINYTNPFIDYISKYNYQIYLIHHRIFLIFIPMILSNNASLEYLLFIMLFLFWIVCKVAEIIMRLEKRLGHMCSMYNKSTQSCK